MTPGFVIWFTGLPAAGKTTLARAVAAQLADAGVPTQLLDSDELRRVLTPQPTYSAAERRWFYSTLVFLARLLATNGVNVLIAATAAARAERDLARQTLPRFAEVYVAATPAACRRRDPKGLWRRVDAGVIRGLPGADLAYEVPDSAESTVDTEQLTVAAAVAQVLRDLAAFLQPEPEGEVP